MRLDTVEHDLLPALASVLDLDIGNVELGQILVQPQTSVVNLALLARLPSIRSRWAMGGGAQAGLGLGSLQRSRVLDLGLVFPL